MSSSSIFFTLPVDLLPLLLNNWSQATEQREDGEPYSYYCSIRTERFTHGADGMQALPPGHGQLSGMLVVRGHTPAPRFWSTRTFFA